MVDNALTHNVVGCMKHPRLRKDQPKRILDDYFKNYEIKHRGRLTESQFARDMTAAGLKIDQSTINRIRASKLYPDVETALKIATYLEVDFSTFIGLEFWAPANPETYLSVPARHIGRYFDELCPADKKSAERIIKALHAPAKDPLTA